MNKSKLCLNLESGWIQGIEHIHSENCNERPEQEISLLVIHNISLPPGEFGTGMIDALFTNQLPADVHPFFEQIKDLRVSAHFLIERCGHIKQYVSCNQRAWHAGASDFHGRANCNDFSIGIELEGTDELPYTDAQYQSLNTLTAVLRRAYPLINHERICGHSDIAPGRKTDPGPSFEWQRLENTVQAPE